MIHISWPEFMVICLFPLAAMEIPPGNNKTYL